jgi:lactose/L-arabinose transport system ATP-binding protein
MQASKILHLDNFLTRKPKALSGGQRQRVAIGRAIVRGPKVFLFDEPLSNLDAELRVEMRIEIARLHKEIGATMIYVTHDQVEAMTLADKIVVLRDGNVEQVGSPMELYKNPNNRFVAGFIGSPSTNFFQTRLKNGDLIIPALDNKIVPTDISEYKMKTSLEVGIRPQNLAVFPDDKSELYIEFRERLGGVSYDYLKTPTGESLTVETKSDEEITPGTKVSVDFEKVMFLIFDGETGNRVR